MQAASNIDTGRLRPIEPHDDAAVAHIIRSVLAELGCIGRGYATDDPEVDAMYETYQLPRSAYFVIEQDGYAVGGGGISPLKGGDGQTCELQKFFILPDYRGLGHGKALIDAALAAAKQHGFARCYLETLPFMKTARAMYERAGFKEIDAPMGSTGHFACDKWYVKEL